MTRPCFLFPSRLFCNAGFSLLDWAKIRTPAVMKSAPSGSVQVAQLSTVGSVTSRVVTCPGCELVKRVFVTRYFLEKNMSYLRPCAQLTKLCYGGVKSIFSPVFIRWFWCRMCKHFSEERLHPSLINGRRLSSLPQEIAHKGLASLSILSRSMSTQSQTLVSTSYAHLDSQVSLRTTCSCTITVDPR